MTDLAKDRARYTRLPGRSGILSVSQQKLWLGDGYILNLVETGYTESQSRFYFGDIQAIAYHRTARREVYTGILGGLLLLFLIFGAWASANFGGFSPGAAALWVVSAFFGALLLLNIFLGPACACHLYTAVQSVRLRAVGREKHARRFLDRVKPLIEAAQGHVTREDLEAHGELSQVRAAAYAEQSPAMARNSEDRPSASGRLHLAFFATMLLVGAFSFLALVEFGAAIEWIGIFVSILFVGLNVAAIIVQARRRVPMGLSILTIAALVYTIITLSLGSMLIGISAGISGEVFDPFSTTPDFNATPLGRGYLMVSGAIEVILGFFGCLMAVAYVRTWPLDSPARSWRPASTADPAAPASDGDDS